MRGFLFGLFVVLGLFGTPAAAGAQVTQSISSSITLSGVVPEMRFIYVDQTGFINRVVGNTSTNITPRVIGPSNKALTLADAILQQYDYFMSQHNWHLAAGVSYVVNPVQINTQASSQSITINNQPQVAANNLQLQAGATPVFGQNG